jgi:hypothetical protein
VAVKLQLGFDWQLRAEPDRLFIRYEVRNASGQDAGLFNRISLAQPGGQPSVSPGNIYIDFDAGLLQLKKQVLPVPKGMQVHAQQIPLVSKLPNGTKFGEEFSVQLPVRVNDPMRHLALSAAHPDSIVVAEEPASAYEIVLSIGAFAVEPGMSFLPEPQAPGAFRVWPPGPAVNGQMILSKSMRLAQPVPVLTFQLQKT